MEYYTERLSEDIVEIIVDYLEITTLSDEELFTSLFPNCSYDSVHRHRRNPRRLFRKLTDRVDDILELMMLTSTYLTGPRAANYFVPGLSGLKSSWIFCCSDSCYLLSTFVEGMMRLGMELDYALKSEDQTISNRSVIRGSLLSDGTMHQIRIVYTSGLDAFEHMIESRHSINQCIVGADAALSAFHFLTKKKEDVDWMSVRQSPSAAYVDKRGISHLTELDLLRKNYIHRIQTSRQLHSLHPTNVCFISYATYYMHSTILHKCALYRYHYLAQRKWSISWMPYHRPGYIHVTADSRYENTVMICTDHEITSGTELDTEYHCARIHLMIKLRILSGVASRNNEVFGIPDTPPVNQVMIPPIHHTRLDNIRSNSRDHQAELDSERMVHNTMFKLTENRPNTIDHRKLKYDTCSYGFSSTLLSSLSFVRHDIPSGFDIYLPKVFHKF